MITAAALTCFNNSFKPDSSSASRFITSWKKVRWQQAAKAARWRERSGDQRRDRGIEEKAERKGGGRRKGKFTVEANLKMSVRPNSMIARGPHCTGVT
jgi:hypothetical protein